ncbi:MAG: fibrobacter succinogenes major paralogous domain-containing protein [Chitinispirillia bacterium]|nr:fibrobacter succinogenes major paralogous domain-containing protein [Chitinispirillia bacterium]MCL2268207.1 fibrobacter succinogenes major paralogous domain-containing protein [Chitinispirillia bacterium]
MKIRLQILLALAVIATGCGKTMVRKDVAADGTVQIVDTVQTAAAAPHVISGTFTDTRDGKTYRTVKIGDQTWMAENLNYETGSSVCYANKESNCQKYGRLYDWDDAMKACPAGWHLPSDAEWTVLTDFVGGEKTAGTKLKSKTGWFTGKGYKAATDDYGFYALPGGLGFSCGSFVDAGYLGYWWSATEYDANSAWYRYMYYSSEGVYRLNYRKSYLFSLRCSQDVRP